MRSDCAPLSSVVFCFSKLNFNVFGGKSPSFRVGMKAETLFSPIL